MYAHRAIKTFSSRRRIFECVSCHVQVEIVAGRGSNVICPYCKVWMVDLGSRGELQLIALEDVMLAFPALSRFGERCDES